MSVYQKIEEVQFDDHVQGTIFLGNYKDPGVKKGNPDKNLPDITSFEE